MGRRGPIPFPTAVKERRGTLEKSREVTIQPEIPVGSVEIPSGVAKPVAALFRELASFLEPARLLTKADAAALARLCTYRHLLAGVLKKCNPKNVTQKTSGGDAASGHMKVALALEEKVRNLEDRFGLTPAARCRIALPPKSDGSQSEAADFS